ncbi:MFS transporter [Micromonospora sp. STR1s_5]|nr:MFS transporter [Micromonospora sp. STR1s_5]
MLTLLKDSAYLRYWLSVVVSFLGDAMTRITLIYVVATLTDDPLMIAAVVIAQLVPSGLFGVLIGPLTDRWPKWSMLVGSDLARLVVVLAMIPLLHSVWALIALVFLQGIGRAIFETARIAAVPKLVPADRVPAAVALFQSTSHTVQLLGPATAGLLIALGSAPMVLVIDAVTFLISALLLAGIPALRGIVTAPGAEPYWRSLGTGIRDVLRVPTLRFLCAFLVPVMTVFGLFITNFNAQLLTVFDLSAGQYGIAHAILGAGSVLGALLGPALVRRYSANGLLLGTAILFGISLVALVPAQRLEASSGLITIMQWCLLVGLGSSLIQVPVANTLLRDLPEALRGRGVGLAQALMTNATILGVAVGGLTAKAIGVAESLVGAGVVLLLSTAAFYAVAHRPHVSPGS